MWNEQQDPVKLIQTTEDLHEALHGQRTAIYCDVQWSIDAVRGRQTFREFALHWNELMPDVPVRFYLIDLTERNAVVNEAVEHWGLSDTSGSGELLWVRDGTPRALTRLTGRLSHAELATLAQQAFDLSAVASFPDQPRQMSAPDWELYEWADPPND
jgi:hypothetical protein